MISSFSYPAFSRFILAVFAASIISSFSVSASSAQHSAMKSIFVFTGDAPATPWKSTNDGVMGGLSEGAAVLDDEGMIFSGNLSLENNGGFSWIHQKGDFDLSEFEGVRFQIKGDGRAYQLRLQTDARFRIWGQVAFSKEFTTVPDEWLEVFVPFAELNQSWRGRQLSGYEFDPAEIERIGFKLADKKPGPFRMTVGWLGAAND